MAYDIFMSQESHDLYSVEKGGYSDLLLVFASFAICYTCVFFGLAVINRAEALGSAATCVCLYGCCTVIMLMTTVILYGSNITYLRSRIFAIGNVEQQEWVNDCISPEYRANLTIVKDQLTE